MQGHLHRWGPSRAGWAAASLTLAAPLAAFGLLWRYPALDGTTGSASSHFYIVSAVAALALVLAVSVIWAARRLPDARTFFLAMGFVSMATIFLADGLGTSPWLIPQAEAQGDPFAAYGAGHAGHNSDALEVSEREEFVASNDGTDAAAPSPTTIARLKVVGYPAQLSRLVSAAFFALATLSLPRQDLATLLNAANGMPRDAVVELVEHHPLTLTAVIDAQAAGDRERATVRTREAASHMHLLGDPLAEATVKKFPDKFRG